MIFTKEKILVHFDTNEVSFFNLKNKQLKKLCKEQVFFSDSSISNLMIDKIDQSLQALEKYAVTIVNEHIRVYATGLFQSLSQADQTRLIIHVYVDFGLYFNIIPQELEQFYLDNSILTNGVQDIMEGLVYQEFRKVVICGSFQQHLNEIGEVMDVMHRHNITVLSPWTTKVIPETLGTDFILLEGQEPLKNARDAWRHKYEHMEKFKPSDAIIICNPDGIIGKGTMFEFGFMVAFSKRIIFTERPKGLTIPFPYEIGLNFE